MRKIFSVLCIAALTFAACDKSDDEPQENTETPEAQIEAGDIVASDSLALKLSIDDGSSKIWKTEAFTLAGSTIFTGCRLDDEMEFNEDGTYIYNGGADLCGAEDNEQVKTGTWEIDFQNQSIIFDRGTSRQTAALLIGQNDNELRLQGSYMAMEVRGVFSAD